jgi:AcrR family transcriptional regulator
VTSGPGNVWLRGEGGRPARRGEPLTLDRIVVAAIGELDEHGAHRLTMRRVADRLGVTSTALYWHVQTKEDLQDLVLDHVLGEVDIPEPGVDPRTGIRSLLLGWRAVMLAHPWSPTLLGRLMLGPNMLARTEYLHSALARTGLTGADLASATSVLAELVVGAVITETTRSRVDPAALARADAYIAERADRYPTLSATGLVARTGWSEDEVFERGLDAVLDAVVRTEA